MKRGKASDIANILQAKFGYVVIGTDDDLAIGEVLPNMVSQGRQDDSESAAVTSKTTYADYQSQAQYAGFSGTCTDCWAYYFRAILEAR